MKRKLYLSCFLLISQLTSCNLKENSQISSQSKSEKLSFINVYGEKNITWENVLNQQENEYFAYIYSETCYYCNEIKKDISYFCSVVFKDFYFVKFSEIIPINNDTKSLINETNQKKLSIKGTPTLFHIKEKAIKECFSGTGEILGYIENFSL